MASWHGNTSLIIFFYVGFPAQKTGGADILYLFFIINLNKLLHHK